MATEYDREVRALSLLHPGWGEMPADQRQALHHTFMWTLSAAEKVGLVKFVDHKMEAGDDGT